MHGEATHSDGRKGGFVMVLRSLQDHPRYRDSQFVHVYLHLQFRATWQPRLALFGGRTISLKPHQLVTSRNEIAQHTGVHPSSVERILKWLKTDQLIEQRGSNTSSLITVHYANPKVFSEQRSEQRANIDRTATEQRATAESTECDQQSSAASTNKDAASVEVSASGRSTKGRVHKNEKTRRRGDVEQSPLPPGSGGRGSPLSDADRLRQAWGADYEERTGSKYVEPGGDRRAAAVLLESCSVEKVLQLARFAHSEVGSGFLHDSVQSRAMTIKGFRDVFTQVHKAYFEDGGAETECYLQQQQVSK
jgi:DNA-binding transcriptional regulator YhcF (GntR family)